MMGVFCVYNDSYIGKCFWTERRSRISSVFQYDDEYISGINKWEIDPAFPLLSGAQPVKLSLPGAFLDASPDRWGKTLIRHRYLRENKEKEGKLRALNDVDYLFGVSDFSRQGDLRFSLEKGSEFLHPSDECPKLVSLPKLLDAAFRYTAEQDENAIDYLLDAGSASLGGARPKAAVLDEQDLYIAKFPHRHDEWDVIMWEWISLRAAAEAGIRVPENRLLNINGQNVLLVKRFDREAGKRIGYISAMTLLGLEDGDQADYFEIAEKLRDVSVSARDDLQELFRRIVLFILLNNTDDHLRNHGFLRSGCGWRLSPVFDVNPNPEKNSSRGTSVFGETRKDFALDALISNSDVFSLTKENAGLILAEVTNAVKLCEKYAKETGVQKSELEMMLRNIGL